jgi:hypothetical protein
MTIHAQNEMVIYTHSQFTNMYLFVLQNTNFVHFIKSASFL